jgi:photosynthetic reaction center H subunit
MSDAIDRVVPLDQLDDFEVADGDPDVRGWKVLASDGRRIGEVDNLLIDTAAMKVRYLDVDLEDGLGDAGEDRHILVPIGYARLDESEDHVFVDSLTSTELSSMPVYGHGPLSREYETSLRGYFDRSFTGTHTGPDFYASDLYDADRFYSARRSTRGNPLA